MPIQITTTRFSPENDPYFNEKARKVWMEYISKRDGLLKKHGIKSLGAWAVPTEHLTISVLEAQSSDAFEKHNMDPEFMAILAYTTHETKVALSMEEGVKMLKQAK